MWFDQADYDVRLEWGRAGLVALLGVTDVVVIVDVLSFSTCVDVAAANGALVFPFAEAGDAARSFAERVGAVCAGRRGEERYSLSPRTFAAVPRGARIVLPSPNGATLSLGTGQVTTLAACLRNATAAGREAQRLGKRITVIAAGERWPDGQLRPAVEDLLGAGAVVSALDGRRSPEAEAGQRAFEAAVPRLQEELLGSASGRQLIELGFPDDVEMAAAWDVSRCAPTLVDGAFRAVAL
jgi:2-phosphosulfolactate phosphatase